MVLVTGGGSGIGRAAAVLFAESGATVVVADIAEQDGEAAVSDIVSAGGAATFVRADVSVEADVENLVRAAERTYGQLDIGFNNAGVALASGVMTEQLDTDTWDRSAEVNLRGTWLCMKYELGVMRPRLRGAIVNTSSVAGLGGLRGGAAYSAAKHGVVGLTRSAAAEYGPHGIRVNAIAPGMTRTAMTRGFIDNERVTALVSSTPLRRVAEPREIAQAALWLASPMASFVTGHVLAVDGGETAT